MPRYQVHWLVKLTGRNDAGVRFFAEGVAENISARGAYIHTERPLRLGEKLDISIQLPLKEENWLVYSAEVVRVDHASHKTGLALMFDSSKPAFTDK